MIVTYEWKVEALHVIPHLNGLDNIIQRVNWNLTGKTIGPDNKEYTYVHPQTTTIKLDESSSFIAAEQLTPEIIQAWVYEVENKKQRNIEWLKANMIDKRLDEQVNPTIAKIVKPFWEQQ